METTTKFYAIDFQLKPDQLDSRLIRHELISSQQTCLRFCLQTAIINSTAIFSSLTPSEGFIVPTKQQYDLKFTGKGVEYFEIWLINILMTVLTLGIYSAWAKVRTNRYFYENTWLDDNNFEYLATPMMILKGRLIAVAVLIAYTIIQNIHVIGAAVMAAALFLAYPWIIWRSIKFNLRMLAYRNVRFSFGGELGKIYLYLFVYSLGPLLIGGVVALIFNFAMPEEQFEAAVGPVIIASILVMYLMVPFIQYIFTSYYIGNTLYGQGEFSTKLSVGKYYMTYLTVVLLMLGGILILGVIGGIVGVIWVAWGGAELQQDTAAANPLLVLLAVLGAYGLMIVASAFAKALVRVRLRKHVFDNTLLDNVHGLESTMQIGSLAKLYIVNILLLIFTLGFATPWVAVRVARYDAAHSSALVQGYLSYFVSELQGKQTSLGEELGEAFDIDMDLAL